MALYVIKIGTSLLRGNKDKSTKQVIESFSYCLSQAKNRGDKIVLVSSGAVGLGCIKLNLNDRPKDLISLQAAASVGQGYLMALYQEYMNKNNINVAQILITRSDFSSRERYRSVSMTLSRLLDWNVIPIVNENDTVSNEELLYGDNDTLSALVAGAINADQLVLLTDIDRLYSADPNDKESAKPITDVHSTKELINLNTTSISNSGWGTGGIKTKLIAAKIATESGIKVHLADGRSTEILSKILEGSRGGTVFHPSANPVGNKKSWLAHALQPVGEVVIDNGACHAIQNNGASLLVVGVREIRGDFSANQAVKLINQEGTEIGRGLCSISSDAAQNLIINRMSNEKSQILIHRDVLVLTGELPI